MKRTMIAVIKRWWVLALVCTLALSLTSCSKKKKDIQGNDYGFSDKCSSSSADGQIGRFEVYVFPSETRKGMYDISIMPVELERPGYPVKIYLFNQSTLQHDELKSEYVLTDKEITLGPISEADLSAFDSIYIVQHEAGVSFLDMTPEKEALCELPLPPGSQLGQTLNSGDPSANYPY